MTSAVIVSTARTPLAKSWKGSFNMTHGATLGGHAVAQAIQRAGIEAGAVDDVIMGCANPEGATGANIGRQIALMAGCPVTTSGMTVNRFCSSGLQTIALAAQRIIAGEADVFVAGGVESISCVQQEMNQHMLADPALAAKVPAIYWSMLQTAEQVAKRYNIARERMDQYGAASQQKACAAQEAGKFKDEIVPFSIAQKKGDPILFAADEFINKKTSAEALAGLRPSFEQLGAMGFDQVAIGRYPQVECITHVHHAGNSSGIVDGAAAVLVGNEAAAKAHGWALDYTLHPDYDHSYYFIASLIEAHLRFHAGHLAKAG